MSADLTYLVSLAVSFCHLALLTPNHDAAIL